MYSVVGVALLGVAGFFIYQAMANSLVYFLLPSEYAEAPQKYDGKVRLGGIVQAGSVHFDDEMLELNFNIADVYTSYPVRYSGAPPELFKPDAGVVVAGHFQNGTFVSDEVLIKHTEQYQPKDGEKMTQEDLKNALE